MNQKTLNTAVSFEGIGLHTGQSIQMTVHPAKVNHGIQFKRTDLEEAVTMKATIEKVEATNRCTTIAEDGAKVMTIEHLLAALAGLGIDNVLVELDGEEVPILDGSSAQLVEAFRKAGIKELELPKKIFPIKENLYFTDDEKEAELIVLPSDRFEVVVMVDYQSSVLAPQHAELKNLDDFAEEIASARTFCFLNELEYLHQNDLIKGGSLDNAIVIADRRVEDQELERLAELFQQPKVSVSEEGILDNTKLRYLNEPARHKLLDFIGDLVLVGTHLQAKFIVTKPGHSSNALFAKKLKDYVRKNRHMIGAPQYDPNRPPVFDITKVEQLLPHKYPFLLVDKIIELSDTSVVGVKNVTFNEPFFQGHFPGNPVMPGVLQVEAMAQTGGVLALKAIGENTGEYASYFLSIEKAKFRNKVIPGDTLIFKLDLLSPIRRGLCEMKAVAYVGNKIATEAILIAQIVKKPKNDQY